MVLNKEFFMFSRLLTSQLLLVLALGFSASNSSAAKIYHWVDEQGRSHYSENLPRDKLAETMNVKAAGVGSAGSGSATTSEKESAAPKKAEQALTTLKAEVSPEDKAKYCQQSRQLMQQMNGNVQRRFEQPDGSYRKLTEGEISEYKVQAQEGISNYCQ